MGFLIILYFIFLYLLGDTFIKIFKFPFKYSLPIGYLSFLAIFQLISLPIMLMQRSFNEVMLVFTLAIIIGVGLIVYFRKNIEFKRKIKLDFEILFIFFSTIFMLLLMCIYNNNGNLADDFFYKSLYVDNLSTENIFTYSPKEGYLFESFPYMYRINSFDLIPSILSKLSGFHPTAIVMWILPPFHFIIFFLTVFDLLRVINKDKRLAFVIFGFMLFHSFYILDGYLGDAFSPVLPSTYLVYLMYSGKFVYFYIVIPFFYTLVALVYQRKNMNLYCVIHLTIIAAISLNTTAVYLNLFLVIAIIFAEIFYMNQPIGKSWFFILFHLLLWALITLYLRFNNCNIILFALIFCVIFLYFLFYINKKSLKLTKRCLISLVFLLYFCGGLVSLLFDDGMIGGRTFIRKSLLTFERYPILYLSWILVTIYLLLNKKVKVEERLLFVIIPIILIIIFFNPFSSGIVSIITTAYTYNRILWIIPVILLLCIYLKDTIIWILEIIQVRNKNAKKIFYIIGLFLLIFSSKEWLYDISYWGKYYNKNNLNFYYDISHDLINMSIYFEELEDPVNVLPFAHEAYYNLRKLTSSANYIVDVNTYQGKASSNQSMLKFINDLNQNYLNNSLWEELIESNSIDYVILESNSDLFWQFRELKYEYIEFGRFVVFKVNEVN